MLIIINLLASTLDFIQKFFEVEQSEAILVHTMQFNLNK